MDIIMRSRFEEMQLSGRTRRSTKTTTCTSRVGTKDTAATMNYIYQISISKANAKQALSQDNCWQDSCKSFQLAVTEQH
eukprot:scaffold9896_cov74-Cylindrotheca_fusiformis.AAC.2